MESRKGKLNRIFKLLYSLKVGDFVELEFDNWDLYKVVNKDDCIQLISVKDRRYSAGYECNDMVDLIMCMLNDMHDGILKNVKK